MISILLAIATREVVPVPKLIPELAHVIATISTAAAVPARIATYRTSSRNSCDLITSSFTKGMNK